MRWAGNTSCIPFSPWIQIITAISKNKGKKCAPSFLFTNMIVAKNRETPAVRINGIAHTLILTLHTYWELETDTCSFLAATKGHSLFVVLIDGPMLGNTCFTHSGAPDCMEVATDYPRWPSNPLGITVNYPFWPSSWGFIHQATKGWVNRWRNFSQQVSLTHLSRKESPGWSTTLACLTGQ